MDHIRLIKRIGPEAAWYFGFGLLCVAFGLVGTFVVAVAVVTLPLALLVEYLGVAAKRLGDDRLNVEKQ